MTEHTLTPSAPVRFDWVDILKGLSIVLVVHMHSTLGVEAAVGQTSWMHHIVDFASTFRMPLFFMVSGLFFYRVAGRDWFSYLDKKVLPFLYFYVLWMSIVFGLKSFADGMSVANFIPEYLLNFIEPYGITWFIYMLAVFFVVMKMLKNVSPAYLIFAALCLRLLPLHTPSLLINEFMAYFLFFVIGAHGYEMIFSVVKWAKSYVWQAMGVVALFVGFNLAYFGLIEHTGFAKHYFLLLQLLGLLAGVVFASLIERVPFVQKINFFGQRSLIIYLAFTLFMGPVRAVLVQLDVIDDAGSIALIVWMSSIVGALILEKVTSYLGLTFLFSKPQWVRLPLFIRTRLKQQQA